MDKRGSNAQGGFTFIDLVMVIAVVAALTGLVLKAAGGTRERTRRTQCQRNLKEIGNVLQLYAQDYKGLLPDCTRSNRSFSGPAQPWNLNTNLVAELQRRGVDRKTLYCPSNAGMNDYHHWEFWRYERGRTRVIGYAVLLKGVVELPQNLWRADLQGDGQNPPDKTELAMDIVASTGGTPDLPLDATANAQIDYTRIQGLWTDRTSHLTGLVGSGRPAGGNITFEDGHAEWRDFARMKHRFNAGGGRNGLWTWDF